jgi:hypothetical protein
MQNQPPAEELWRAIDTYLAVAYGAELPRMLQPRLASLRALPPERLYGSGEFEPVSDHALALRLGNRNYPHMKLVIEDSPDGATAMYRVDTHDVHCCPQPGSGEYGAFRALMADNERVARAVEGAWAAEGLPTFKRFLEEDLARRTGQARGRP